MSSFDFIVITLFCLSAFTDSLSFFPSEILFLFSSRFVSFFSSCKFPVLFSLINYYWSILILSFFHPSSSSSYSLVSYFNFSSSSPFFLNLSFYTIFFFFFLPLSSFISFPFIPSILWNDTVLHVSDLGRSRILSFHGCDASVSIERTRNKLERDQRDEQDNRRRE